MREVRRIFLAPGLSLVCAFFVTGAAVFSTHAFAEKYYFL